MALNNLKLKLKNNLKQQIEEESKKGGGGNDPRFLNYWDLKDEEKVKILFVPDVNGELWARFRKHGPSLNVRGAGSIRCAYESSGVDCPACQKGFDLLNLEKETGAKEYKDEAKRWFAKEYVLMSCIVLDSPFEVNEAADHNQVKLTYVPYGIEKLIKEAVTEGQLGEDDLCTTPFFIKKTTNKGGYADYSNSYFARKAVTDDELEFFSDLKVEQYDYSTLDLIPAASTTEEVEEWLVKAVEAVNKASKEPTKSGASKTTEDRPLREKAPTRTPSDEIDEDQEHMGEARQAAEEEPPKPAKGSLKDRLANLR